MLFSTSPFIERMDGANVWFFQSDQLLPDLPAEIWNIIFSFLELEDRCIASSVCRAWYKYAWVCITSHTLTLRQRMFQDKIIANILHKSQLVRHLTLVDCFCVTPAILQHIPVQIQSLQFINCPYFARNCRVNHLKQLPMLFSLELPNCIHLEICELLPHLPRSLKTLNLKGCKLSQTTSPLLGELLSFPNLTHLNLSFITDSSLTGLLSNLPSGLEELIYKGATLAGVTFECIPIGLKVLDIAFSRGLSTTHFQHLSRLASLRKLNLDACSLESIVVESFGLLPSSLHSLSLRECYPITDGTLLHFPQWLQNLNLALCNSNKQAGESTQISSWSSLPSTLVTLNLSRCSLSDDNSFMLPPNLESLCVFGTQLTSNGLKNIPNNIVELDLSWCPIDDSGLSLLAESNPKLQCLNISNTNVSKDGLARFQMQRPNVCILKGSRLE